MPAERRGRLEQKALWQARTVATIFKPGTGVVTGFISVLQWACWIVLLPFIILIKIGWWLLKFTCALMVGGS